MAEDSDQEKTEEPTSRRLEKAREEGQLPRSKDLSSAVILMAGTIGLLLFGGWMAEHMVHVARLGFSFERETAFDLAQLYVHLGASIKEVAFGLAPWFILMMIAALAGPIMLGGWLFSMKAVMPKLSKLNPISGLKRMFSMNSLVELFKSIAKVLVVSYVAWLVTDYYFLDAMALSHKPVEAAIDNSLYILIWAIILISSSLLIIVLFDVPWQIYSHTKKLRMTKQEIKDEFKDTEGQPEIKSKIRQKQMEMAQNRMLGDVPTADVVITNPTHYSVALKYEAGGASAPIMVAKGGDHLAFKIREIAKEHNVPQMQAPPLARALYTYADVGKEIPEGLYVAVAQVLAYIYQMDLYVKGHGPKPERKPDMPIPKDLRVDPD
ncbi:MAG: flagellar biosynthesis protein FlhB [Venatoribacter sp.]